MLKYAVSSKDCTPHSMFTLDANAVQSQSGEIKINPKNYW